MVIKHHKGMGTQFYNSELVESDKATSSESKLLVEQLTPASTTDQLM